MNMELNYHEDLKIDKHKLDVEWENQPYKYKLYSDAWAEADKEKRTQEDNVKRLKGVIYNELRNNPPVDEKGKPVKLTDKYIESLVNSDERMIEARKMRSEAIYNANILENAKWAFQHRKDAIEKLTDLWGMQYFGKPKNTFERNQTREENTGHSRPGLRKRENTEAF
jgi:hypothetical protein